MLARRARRETGVALISVLLIIVVLSAVGAFMLVAVDRNTELRVGFQKNVAGQNAAEAGLNAGAAQVETAMLNFGLPTNCSAQTLTINGRTVTYTLSVPTGPPWNGVAGSCTETYQPLRLPAGDPYAGLNADIYTYNLTSQAVNVQGYTEANLGTQFQARFIPVFQFLGFYANDLEVAPGERTAVFFGRMHTNGDLYLSEEHCPPGAEFLGQLTIVGSGISGTVPLTRGRKFNTGNRGEVQISLDGTGTNLQALGASNPTDACNSNFSNPPRQVPQSEINTFNGRIQTGLKTINIPSEAGVICTPWTTSAPGNACSGGTAGTYWQRADVRIVLDLTAAMTQLKSGSVGPPLYPVKA